MDYHSSKWFLKVLTGDVPMELDLLDSMSHIEIRNILLKHGRKYRQSNITLGGSTDPEYHLKKMRIEGLRYSHPLDSVLLYEHEKGTIVAKTYGGTSWSSTV